MLTCHECAFQAENAKGLSYHVRVRHNKAYPDYLVKHEMGGVWPTCVCGCGERVRFLCGKFCEHVGNHFHVGKSRSQDTCHRIGQAQIGAKRSPESNAKRSASMLDYHSKYDNVRDAVRLAKTGVPMSEATRAKLSATRKSMFASGDLVINREAISKSITKLYLEGGFQWCVGEYTSSKTGEVIFYRSSWELAYAELLDNDPTVVTWEYEPFSIVYRYGKKMKNYLPDFLVTYDDGIKELVEVKPKQLETYGVNVAKRDAALTKCVAEGWHYAGWSLVSTQR